VNTQTAQPSPLFARVRKALTGGVVALVAGALLATGMTSVATAAAVPTLNLTVKAGDVAVAGVDVEVYDRSPGWDYKYSIEYGTTDENGFVSFTNDSLKPGADYVISVTKGFDVAEGFDAYSNGFISGTQSDLVDDFVGAMPVHLTAGVNNRTVSMLTGATLTGAITTPAGDAFDNSQSATAYRKSTDILTGDVSWVAEGTQWNQYTNDNDDIANTFNIEGLRSGEYAVQVSNEIDDNFADYSYNDGASGPAYATLGTVTRLGSNVIDVTMVESASISGTVTVPEGYSISEGTIGVGAYLKNPNGPLDYLTVGSGDVAEDGSFTITGIGAGDYYIESDVYDNSGIFGEWFDDAATLATATAVETGTTDVTIALGEGFSVGGRVTAGGIGVSGVKVDVIPEDYTDEDAPTATTDSEGYFSVSGIAPASYTIEYTLEGDDYASHFYTGETAGSENFADAVPVAAVHGVINADLELPGVATVVARVTDAKGAAAKSAWVEIIAVKDGARDWDAPSAIASAVSGKPGSYSAELATGHVYTISTDVKGSYWQYLGGVPASIEGSIGNADVFEVENGLNTVDVSLAASGAVSGTVKSTAKKALAGVSVTLFQWNGSTWERAGYSYTTKTGAYSVVNVQPGSYKVGFETVQGASEGFVANYNFVTDDLSAIEPIYVGKGASVVANGTLAPGGSITGTITNADGDAAKSVAVLPIKLEGEPGEWYSRVAYNAGYGFTDAKGKFTAKGLPAGKYALSFTDESNSESGLLGNTYTLDQNVTYYTVTAGKTTTIPGKIELPAFGTTEVGTVTGTVSPAVEDIFGEVRFNSTEGLNSDYVLLDGSNDFSIKLSPGEYEWSSNFEGSGNGDYAAQSGFIYVEAGDNSLTIAAEPKSPLTFDSSPVIKAGNSAVTTARVGTSLFASAEWSKGQSTYQWYRDGLPIFGAYGNTYTPRGGDIDKAISVRVTLDNGFADYNNLRVGVVEYSAPVTVTLGAQIQSWGNVQMSATKLSPGSVITSTDGYFDTYPVTPSYEWLVDGEVVAGETSKSYVIRTADIGLPIRSRVTANRLGYESSAPVTSADALVAVIGDAPTLLKAPTVKAAKAGAETKYTVTPGTWSLAGTTASYTWYLDGEAIEGRTSAAETFSLEEAPAEKAITVGVIASKEFYASSNEAVVVARKGTALTSGEARVVFDGNSVSSDSQVFIGNTLVATGGFDSPDGSDVTVTYQWQRQTGTKWAAIAKATASTYKVVLADAGKNLRVVITVASARYATSTVTATAGVGTLDDTLARYAAEFDGSVAGTAAVSSTLTAPAIEWPVSGVKSTYQWSAIAEGVPTLIKGATKSTYVVPANSVGKLFSVKITGTKTGYETAEAFADSVVANTGTITALSPLEAIGVRNVDGDLSVKVGTKLTAKPTTVDVTGVKRAYQWAIKLPGVENLQLISGATKTTYTVTAADAATDGASLVLLEDISKADFITYAAGTDPILIERIPATVKTAPKVTKSGDTYTATAGVYTPAGGQVSYEWYINGNLSDTSTPTYTPGDDQGSALIEVAVSYVVAAHDTRVTTLVAQKVAPPVLSETEIPAPRALETSYADWSSSSDYPLSDYSIQWYLGTKAIKGATKFEYTPTLAQVSKKLKFIVTLNSPKTTKVTLASTPQTVLGAYGAENGTAAGSGYTSVGQTLTATVAEKRAGFTVSYNWARYEGESAEVLIPGATKLTYKTTAADAGTYVFIRTTYKRTGHETTVYNSDAWYVLRGDLDNLAVPTITGSGAVGGTLTATPGTWTNSPTLSYQWLRNNQEIPGASSSKFTPTGDFYGDEISVEVSARKAGFSAGYETSAPIAVTKGAAPTIVGTATPKLTGTVATCNTLTATAGTWSLDGIDVKYQWYLIDGGSKQLIQGATKSTYTPGAGEAGFELKVIVTAERPGYATGISETGTTAALAQGCEL